LLKLIVGIFFPEIFPCPDCGKNFSRKSNLKVSKATHFFFVKFKNVEEIYHITIFQAHRDSLHFGKKFPCCYCDRIFTNRSSMNQHIKKSHTDTLQSVVAGGQQGFFVLIVLS
jgi:uncharacterized C2H2 Zn-finger protein